MARPLSGLDPIKARRLLDIFFWEKTSFAEKSCVAELYPDKDTKSHVSLKENVELKLLKSQL